MLRSIDPKIRRQLRTILAQFYPDESSIRRVAADAGVDLSRTPLNNHATNDWHRVLDEAAFVNRLSALLDVVEEEYAANADWQRICDAYRQATKQITHEDYTSHIERVGDQLSDSQAHEQTTEDHAFDQSSTEATAQETFQIERAVRNHRDFAALLRQSDFVPKEERNGRELIVVRPKVAVTCTLPIAISEGSCSIKFSDPFLRGLTIELGHKGILEYFVIGRNMPFKWKSRKFIRILQDEKIQLSIEPIEVILTEADATDLCSCVDVMASLYISTMLEAENILEAWNLPLGRQYVDSDEYGYEILTVSVETWQQMLQFSKSSSQVSELEYDLYAVPGSFQIETESTTHAEIVSKALYINDGLPPKEVSLLYLPPRHGEAWREHIGAKGIWTIDFTRAWFLNQFFPLLQNPYFREPLSDCITHPDAFWRVVDTKHLWYHVTVIHRWVSFGHDVTQNLLISYCKAFAQLLSQANIEEKSDSYRYIIGHLVLSDAVMKSKDDISTYRKEHLSSYQESLQSSTYTELRHKHLCTALRNNARCLEQFEYVEHRATDYLLRAHQVLLQDIKINSTQSAINNFKKALWPLFERASFGNRFIDVD